VNEIREMNVKKLILSVTNIPENAIQDKPFFLDGSLLRLLTHTQRCDFYKFYARQLVCRCRSQASPGVVVSDPV